MALKNPVVEQVAICCPRWIRKPREELRDLLEATPWLAVNDRHQTYSRPSADRHRDDLAGLCTAHQLAGALAKLPQPNGVHSGYGSTCDNKRGRAASAARGCGRGQQPRTLRSARRGNP